MKLYLTKIPSSLRVKATKRLLCFSLSVVLISWYGTGQVTVYMSRKRDVWLRLEEFIWYIQTHHHMSISKWGNLSWWHSFQNATRCGGKYNEKMSVYMLWRTLPSLLLYALQQSSFTTEYFTSIFKYRQDEKRQNVGKSYIQSPTSGCMPNLDTSVIVDYKQLTLKFWLLSLTCNTPGIDPYICSQAMIIMACYLFPSASLLTKMG